MFSIRKLTWLCAIITLSFNGHVLGEDSAKMTVYGLHTGDGSTITLCPNDTYLIYIECDVTGFSLQWQFGQLGNPVSFTADVEVGREEHRSPITVTLTEKLPDNMNSKYKSQLKTFSDELRNTLDTDRGMELSCSASPNVKDTVSIVVPVEHKPSIDNASLMGNELKVMWSTTTSDIVTIAVVIENIEKGFQSTTFVEWNKREETILVETDAIPYNAAVIVYDRCRESYKSDVYTVNPIFVDPTSVTPTSTPTLPLLPSNVSGRFPSLPESMSTPSVVLFTPPTSQQECNTRDTAVVGLSITLALAFIFIMGLGGILIFVIWKKTSASSQGGFSHKGFELKEPRENERD